MSENNERSQTTLVLGFPKSSPSISRIKTIDGIKVLAQAGDRTEALKRTMDFHPDILFVTSSLEGTEEWSILVSTIPESIRILMYLESESEMNILVKDMLEENGVEFVSDLSVGGLQTLFLGSETVSDDKSYDKSDDKQDDNDEPEEKSTKVIKPRTRGKLGVTLSDRLGKLSEVQKNVAKTALNVVAEAAESAKSQLKNINIPTPSIPSINTTKTEKAVKYKNIITVYSDFQGTGITFVASNVAVKLSEIGYKVCLVDLSSNNTIHTMFKLPLSEDNLKIVSETAEQSVEGAGFFPRRYPGLCIFANSPDVNINLSDLKISNFIKNLSAAFDFVIIDTCSLSVQTALAFSAKAIEVTDIDATHWTNKPIDKALVVNKHSDSAELEIEPAKDVKNLFLIPMRHDPVMRGIYTSILPCTFDDKLNLAFLKIAEYIEVEGGSVND